MAKRKQAGTPRGKTPSDKPHRGEHCEELRYPIPHTSAQAWEEHKTKQPQNPGLILDRFALDWSIDAATLKRKGLDEVRRAAERVDEVLLAQWNARWEAVARIAGGEIFSLRTDWRFVAGLGDRGSMDVGFTFHRYGLPILPGSSVKGIARAWGLLQVAERLKTDELKQVDMTLSEADEEKYTKGLATLNATPDADSSADRFREIFGTTGAVGGAVFFDAIPAPTRPPKLDLDVMNPHYPKYYQGNEPPADWQSPLPVYFLTVALDQEFRFAVAWRGPTKTNLQELAAQWLARGLMQLGAGAKTSAGYGYFR